MMMPFPATPSIEPIEGRRTPVKQSTAREDIEFGWDRGLTSLAYSLSWVSFGCLSTVAGRLVDRFGPRTVMFVGTLIVAVRTRLLGQLHSLWQLYPVFGLMLPIGKAPNSTPLGAPRAPWALGALATREVRTTHEYHSAPGSAISA
jgi:MFS family permease